MNAPLKIIVSIDNTGSNGSNVYSTNLPGGKYEYGLGSDNDQAFRQSSVNALVDSVASLSNIKFSLMQFQDLRWVGWRGRPQGPFVHALINAGDDQAPAFGDAQTMKSALAAFKTTEQDGNTEFFSVLRMMKQAIVNDPQFNAGAGAAAQNYAIVLLSDGEPTERVHYAADGSQTITQGWTSEDEADLLAEVRSLVGLAPGRITFNTVFYNQISQEDRMKMIAKTAADAAAQGDTCYAPDGTYICYDPVDPNAPYLLQKMAIAGAGQFANANVEGMDKVKLTNVITVPSVVCAAQ